MPLFEGLEGLGFDKMDAYDDYLYKEAEKTESKKETPPVPPLDPTDYLFQRKHECPVCGKNFENTAARQSKVRLVSSDLDLKPVYEPIDPTYYDVILCPHCGYAALSSFFGGITERQIAGVHSTVSARFRSREYPVVLTAEMAIERYKLALLCCMAKGAKSGEKAVICLRIAWLYRDMGDTVNERLFIENAYNGFMDAYGKQTFPIAGIDHDTAMFLVGELARRIGDIAVAKKWIGTVITKRNINARLKQRALDVKDLLLKAEASA